MLESRHPSPIMPIEDGRGETRASPTHVLPEAGTGLEKNSPSQIDLNQEPGRAAGSAKARMTTLSVVVELWTITARITTRVLVLAGSGGRLIL